MANDFRLKPHSKDPNDQAKMALARGQFARAVDAGQVGAYDRLKRKLAPGDYVFYRPEQDIIWEVTGVDPILDDSAPPGSVRVRLGAVSEFNVLANNLNPRLVKIGERPTPEVPPQEPSGERGSVDPSEADPRD